VHDDVFDCFRVAQQRYHVAHCTAVLLHGLVGRVPYAITDTTIDAINALHAVFARQEEDYAALMGRLGDEVQRHEEGNELDEVGDDEGNELGTSPDSVSLFREHKITPEQNKQKCMSYFCFVLVVRGGVGAPRTILRGS